MLDKEVIGDRLGEWASDKGWSLSQLARKAGLANTTVRQMTAGGSMTFENVNAVLGALDLSWYDLLDATLGPRNADEDPATPQQEAPSAVDFTRTVARLVEQHHRQLESMDSEISGLREEQSRAANQFAKFLGRVLVLAGVGPADQLKMIQTVTKEMGGDAEGLGALAAKSIQRNAR